MLLNVHNISDLALYCGIIGTVIFAIKTLMPMNLGPEVDTDFGSVADSDASLNIFTIESISAFFMCAGWLGWLCLSQLHYSLKLSAIISVVSGIIGMLFFAWLITQCKKLEHIPNPSYDELVNRTGKAYLNFAPKGSGKIQIEFNSKLETLEAKNISEVEIKSFESIKVVKIENNEIYIEKE